MFGGIVCLEKLYTSVSMNATGKQPSQSETAYRRLFDAILKGEIQPGDRVREVEVSERLGLSRTPVRDALRRLETEGVIEHRPRQGAVIRSLGHSEVVELYEMRLVLEVTAAEMAAQHATEAEIDEIEALNDEMLQAIDRPDEAARLNASLHRCLYHAARNRFLLESTRTLGNALMLLGPTTLDDADRVRLVHAQHAEIVAALRDRDASKAGQAARTHLETSMRHRLRSLRA